MLRPLSQGTNIINKLKKKKSFSSGSQISTMQTLPFSSTEEWDRNWKGRSEKSHVLR